jgi:hypothetical protein
MEVAEHCQRSRMTRRSSTPLPAVLGFTFLNSIATGVVTTGIAFLATAAYHFGPGANYLLSCLSGLTYTIGALAAGPLALALQRRFPLFGVRRLLLVVIVGMAALAALPLALDASVAPWVLMGLYSPLTGISWPIVEAYLSGGRRELERAVVRFNLTWSFALSLGYWAMGPLLARAPLAILGCVAAVHVISLVVAVRFDPVPQRHEDEAIDPLAQRRAREQLPWFRALLPVSYLLFSALTPILPTTFGHLDITIGWQAPLAATWMVARFLTFGALGQWRGWFGHRATPWVGGALIASGFATTVLAPMTLASDDALLWTIAALAAFGIGMGIIYTAALTYALEAGRSEVDAGGTHEALIGAGYLFGPAAGLAAVACVRFGLVPPALLEPAMVALAGAGAIAMGAIGLALARRARIA